MKNVMVDIETLGRRAGCIVLSIGAVEFNPITGETGSEFYVNIDPFEMLKKDFHTDPDTVQWWTNQSKEAKDALLVDRKEPLDALLAFVKFCQSQGDIKFWSQGSAFDAPILDEVLRIYDIPTPWKFWNVRDTRTVYDICNFDPRSVRRSGVYHSALADCKHQVLCLKEALKCRT